MIDYRLEETAALGAAIAGVLRAGDMIGLSGDLGAGKTTLARAILAALGLAGEAPSPSYAIVQPYAPPETQLPVVHADLYRIDDQADIAELGLADYRHDHAILVEWPERMGSGAPPDMLVLAIEFVGDAMRRLTAQVPPAWEKRWPPR
ncbi:MAG: tRNA (adenosine(37)-N6)-threonylcarbamoyltransferase complex ATPase subunit type 1 TsaE [Sphingomonadales bacterium]|nr:tRNA (adenosine(37)-N6)-threonylcarbamoyltransferase complex ATPase subunit type 1 TsaE [Sphingomonadales bacterium]